MTLPFKYKPFTYSHFIFLFAFLLVFFGGCKNKNERREMALYSQNDLQRIQETGVLKVVTDYNSTNYFIYRGEPMGYQYELLMALCADLKVKPEITVSNDMTETFDGLKSGRFDLIAKNLTVSRARSAEVDFTEPLKLTRQVVVQRKPSVNIPDSVFLHSIHEMSGKTIHVQKNTNYYRRLVHFSETIGIPFEIVEDPINGVEQLIAQVSKGEINYTVCDENVAEINKSYYTNLDVSLKISYPQNIAWAVRKGSVEWKNFLDQWILQFKETSKYRQIYYHYFESPRTSAWRFYSGYHSISGGDISQFDPLVKELASNSGWDWRLISSIMFHESKFDSTAESWAGAKGLMQLMPNTVDFLGVENIDDPRQNIEGGILLLSWLDKQLMESVPDSTERTKFVLASYNIGLGHVKDAQRLAEKYGKNNRVWDENVDYFLRYKSSEKYLNDPVVQWGYCRGEEAYNYVDRVVGNYRHYLNLIPE